MQIQTIVLVTAVIFVLVVLGLLSLAVRSFRKPRQRFNNPDPEFRPRGIGVGIGISIGAGFGVALGMVFDNLAIGIAIGAAIGASLGGVWELSNVDKIKPLSGGERKLQIWAIAGILLLLIGIGFAAFFLMS